MINRTEHALGQEQTNSQPFVLFSDLHIHISLKI